MKLWLASYPRSGNTYFRNVLYDVYGIRSSTFHDESDYPLDAGYADYDVVKTHLLPSQLVPSDPAIPAVYLIRDGRDCMVSLARYRQELFREQGDYAEFVREAIEASGGSYFGGWSRHVREWTARADLVIRFEELICNPIRCLEQLRKWLDLPEPDVSKLPTFEQLRQRDHRYGSGLEHGFSDEERARWRKGKFRRGKAGAWRDELSLRQQLHFLSRHGSELVRMGYEPAIEDDRDAPEEERRPIVAPFSAGSTHRVVIDGVKLLDARMDGIRRYTWEILCALDELTHDDAAWSIDVSLGGVGIIPLRTMITSDDLEESIVKRGLPPLLWPSDDNPLRIARNKLSQGKGRPIAARCRDYLNYKRLSLLRSFYKRSYRWKRKPLRKVDDYDLLHLTLPNTWHHYRRTILPVLTTVHDLCHLVCPELQISSNVEPLRNGLDWSRLREASYVAVSQATRDQMISQLGLSAESIHVVPNSVRTDCFHPGATPRQIELLREKYRIPEGPFLLCLGTIEPRKNLLNAVRAFKSATELHPDLALNLVIAGGKGWGNHRELLTSIDRNPRIHTTGFVEERDLPVLYSAARALCYVSLYEGFGLPLLEAMACGTPVIYGDNSAMPEVVGGGGLSATATDTGSIATAMLQIVQDESLYARLAQRAVKRAHRTSWSKAARQTLLAYTAAIAAAKKTANSATVVALSLPNRNASTDEGHAAA